MTSDLMFRRENLAKAYCDSLSGIGVMSGTSGLFLAAPRRVGKTTFLITDLIPEALQRDWYPIYVDLWADKNMDPATLLAEAIKKEIAALTGKFKKLKQKLQKITLFKLVELDFTKPGLQGTVTLVDVIKHLSQITKKPLLLVIDEAQHALVSQEGLNAMFSIKSARDQLNKLGRVPNLMLVLTGSNRDKLAQLLINKDHPFFGSSITSFPLLGRTFTDFFTAQVNRSLVSDNHFDAESVWNAFVLLGNRPELLKQIMGELAIGSEAKSLSSLLIEGVSSWNKQFWSEFEKSFDLLTPLAKTLLEDLLVYGAAWLPFSQEALARYQSKIAGDSLSKSSIQKTIALLRTRGFIWQSSRGSYAFEDDSFASWLEKRLQDSR